jgi:hypothetical protein
VGTNRSFNPSAYSGVAFLEGRRSGSGLFRGRGEGTYALYDSATGRLIAKLKEPADEALLPQWAKSRVELDDESVPISAELTQERTKWIAKALRQIGKIKLGMRRKDLLTTFTNEGGTSYRTKQTYVYIECPYIKVDVHFKAVGGGNHLGLNEHPNDVIESISQPYLAWSVVD